MPGWWKRKGTPKKQTTKRGATSGSGKPPPKKNGALLKGSETQPATWCKKFRRRPGSPPTRSPPLSPTYPQGPGHVENNPFCTVGGRSPAPLRVHGKPMVAAIYRLGAGVRLSTVGMAKMLHSSVLFIPEIVYPHCWRL